MSGAIKAEKPGRRKRLTPRSRSGCLSCRHHHRKCDEQRPVCGLCQKFGRDCDYGLKLTWGGRPFQKSAFGQCLSHRDTSIGKIKIDRASGRGPGPFVYGFREPQAKNPLKALELNQEEQALVVKTNETPVICAPPSVLPDLPPPYRALLDYFTHVADSFSCDELVKADFNSTFIPIAINTSHVMAAMLNLAAVHGANSGRDQSPKQMAYLQVVAVEQLRSKLVNPSSSSTEAILSSILLLCYSEIVAGGGPSQSWRLHLEGAASVLREDLNSWNMKSSENGKAFLARCFVSLVALASVSGHPPSAAVSQLAMEMSQSNSQLRKVDEFTAYSTDLVQVLIELGERLRKRGTDGIAGQTMVESSPVASLDIVQRVHQMLQRGKGNLGNRALLKLPAARKQEYLHMDEAYHQAALVHIYQRLRGLPSSSNEIQTVVRRVLNLVSTIQLHQGPCPGIVLLFPLFSAGVGAVSLEDRQHVRSMLSCMVDKFGLGNVQQSMRILEALWSHRDRYGESEANITWEGFIDENTDLILY